MAPKRFKVVEQSQDGKRALFEMRGVDVCVVNAIRRAIMSDVRTAAFPFDPTGMELDPHMRVLRNTTALHNEMLLHRLSMVPIMMNEKQLAQFDASQWKFLLHVRNLRNAEVINVTTKDIEVFDAVGARVPQATRDALFPPDPLSKDHILLVRLRPIPTSAIQPQESTGASPGGEEVWIEMRARTGTGREHAGFSPHSRCFHRYKVDPRAAAEDLAKRLEEVTEGGEEGDARKRAIAAAHASLDQQRCYEKDARGEPAALELFVHVEVNIRPLELVRIALLELRRRVSEVHMGLSPRRTEEEGPDGGGKGDIDIMPALNQEDMWHVTLRGEDHTLGNLLQGSLYRLWLVEGRGEKVNYVGYHVPHPLERIVLLRMKMAVAGDDPRAALVQGVRWVEGELDRLLDDVEAEKVDSRR